MVKIPQIINNNIQVKSIERQQQEHMPHVKKIGFFFEYVKMWVASQLDCPFEFNVFSLLQIQLDRAIGHGLTEDYEHSFPRMISHIKQIPLNAKQI